MARRYGRNQRRAHREDLAKAIEANKVLQDSIDAIRQDYARKLKTLQADALDRFLKEKPLEKYLQLLIEQLARDMTPEVKTFVDQVMRSCYRHDKFDRPLEFRARQIAYRDKPEVAIEVTTPELEGQVHYLTLKPRLRGMIVE